MVKINRVISTLILSDLFLFFALGLLTPIFGVFVLENIEGSSLKVVGIASSFYWIARVVSVVPISRVLDKVKGEKDEFYSVLIGTYGLALLPSLYIFATHPHHVYIIELLRGIANSFAVPAWRILFTKFVDQKLIGLEWSFEDVSVGLATAVSAILGAIIADTFGFRAVFVMVSVIGVIGATILTRLYKDKRISQEKTSFWDFFRKEISGDKAPFKIDTIK